MQVKNVYSTILIYLYFIMQRYIKYYNCQILFLLLQYNGLLYVYF